MQWETDTTFDKHSPGTEGILVIARWVSRGDPNDVETCGRMTTTPCPRAPAVSGGEGCYLPVTDENIIIRDYSHGMM